MKRKILEVGVLVIIGVLSVLVVQTVSAEEIEIDFSFTEPDITEVNVSNITYHKVIMNDTDTIGNTGCPMIPVRLVKVLLPQNGTLESINISYSGNTSLGSGYNITLGPETIEFNSTQQNQSNQSYYNSSKPYPTKLYGGTSVYGFRGYSILVFNLYPVHYINDTGEIYYYENMNLTIITNDTGSPSSLFRNLQSDEIEMKQKVDDYSMSVTYTSYPDPPSERYDLVIITKEKFINTHKWWGPNWLTFQDLANYKNEKTNIKTTIKSVEDIYEEYSEGEDNAEKIRMFIQDKFIDWQLKYVLLGGDKNVVPVRALWGLTSKGYERWIPSDLYYACLEGNYNDNDNHVYGEPKDGEHWHEGDELDSYEVLGGGLHYVEAGNDSKNDEKHQKFNVSLFTPCMDLSEYESAKLTFAGNFQIGKYGDYMEVRVKSGEFSPPTHLEEVLDHVNESDVPKSHGTKYEYDLDLPTYSDPEHVYIEFYYLSEGFSDGSFNIDDVNVTVPDPDEEGWKVILFESFEDENLNWINQQYSGTGKWVLEDYVDDLDLLADVYVGRACVENLREVNNFVLKTLGYERDTNPNEKYIGKALLLGVFLDTKNVKATQPAQKFKDEIRGYQYKNGYITHGIPEGNGANDYTIDTLYDINYKDNYKNPLRGWPPSYLREKLNDGLGQGRSIINCLGHGWVDKIARPYCYFWENPYEKVHYRPVLSNTQSLLLANNKYFFMYSQSCNTGNFNDTKKDCLAEFLTVKTKHGAFAVIMNSVGGHMPAIPSTDGESQRFDREFFDAIFGENIYELGKANQDSKEDCLHCLKLEEGHGNFAIYRRCYYQLNLFGDPTVSIKIPEKNNPASKPTAPQKSSQDGMWYTFSTDTTDPEVDKVSYKWECDDQECQFWTKYYTSGDTIYNTIWLPPGTHQIRVKSRDTNLDESNWSDPLPLTVSFNSDIVIDSSPTVLGEQAQLNGQATGGTEPYTTWYYDFGDGTNSTEQNTTHTYNATGTYNVTLTVTDSQNISSNTTKAVNVVILNSDFENSPGCALANETIDFNDMSNGYHTITNWLWDFGDGNTSNNRNTTHAYATEGVYNVSLTVTDDESNNNVSYQTIYVDAGEPEITSASSDLDEIGNGYKVTITAYISDGVSGIKTASVSITYPDDTHWNYTMNNTNGNTYEYIFSDTYQLGEYSYTIWAADQAENLNSSSQKSFNVIRSFGYRKIGSLNQSIWDTITGTKFKVNLKGVADNITVYIDPGNATSDSHYQCMIYRHNDSTLMGISEEKNVTGGKGWQTFNFSVPKPVLMNDTEYVLGCWADNYTVKMYYDNTTEEEMFYDDGTSTLPGHYFEGVYNYTPEINNFEHENRNYSIYCRYTPDDTPPEITNVSDTPGTVGFGFNVTINADVTDNASGVDIVTVNITYPDDTYSNFTMNNTGNNTYEYVFSDTWQVGQYDYTIWAVDYINNSNSSSGHSFTVSAQATISVCTLKDSYGNNETINITDPPGDPPSIGYELLDSGNVLHIWNKYDSYYFDTNSGIQLTNHYNEYWSHNVLMLGYYNNNEWNLIYRTDELSGFNKNIETDNETYVNATLWKDLTCQGYDFRLAIRYHLGLDDSDLTVIPYIKNLGQEIPYVLGFGWEIKDIRIANVEYDNYLQVFNGTGFERILLSQSVDKSFADMDHNTTIKLICTNPPSYHLSRSLYLSWDESLNYKVTVKSRTGQYNAPVTLFVKIGTLDVGQEKYTQMHWLDSDSWLGLDGDNCDSWCCDDGYMTPVKAMNGTGCWCGPEREVHWLILDLGSTYNITKVRGRSDTPKDPTKVNVYVSDSKTSWGTAVATDISTWQDTSTWQEVDTTDKDGRYIKIEITETEDGASGAMDFGDPEFPFVIFDAYGDIAGSTNQAPEVSNPYPSDNSSGIGVAPLLNITVVDPDGDSMNITWLSNSSGSWVAFGWNNRVSNGTYHQTMVNASVNGAWWYWKVNVYDGANYAESSVYKFYTGYESKIVNTGSTVIKGYLLMQVQFYNETSESWVVADDTVNESSPRIINWDDPYSMGEPNLLALDTVFNGLVNTQDLSEYGNGTYRIYAAFRDSDGNVLVCDDETELVATYEFEITFG